MPALRLFAPEHPVLKPSLETGYAAVSGSTGFLSGAALGLADRDVERRWQERRLRGLMDKTPRAVLQRRHEQRQV